jgi:hypothetical protein
MQQVLKKPQNKMASHRATPDSLGNNRHLWRPEYYSSGVVPENAQM